jgi:SpoVK/Ycf46/Vps4 family AAA+-type ATPase
MNDALLEILSRAVAAAPDDLPLRLRLAELLVRAGRSDEAITQLAVVLAAEPGNRPARALLTEAFAVPAPSRFDWDLAEADLVPPMSGDEHPGITLADVGGRTDVKSRLRALSRTGFGGGLILYGPPGVGKAFLAKAIAGELGARYIAISLAGLVEQGSLHQVFQLARRGGPCVLFLDDVDAIGPRRPAANQLITELDSRHDGVVVLAGSQAPWDVDATLRRPGRLDRTLLVPPPDENAREAILRQHLSDRPHTDMDIGQLAARTGGMTGTDLANVCEAAAERALLDSAASGTVRMIEVRDLNAAIAEVHPSARAWFDTARTKAGNWDELVRYLRENRL